MDDGGIDTFKVTHLNTDSFNLNDINLLQVALKDKFYLRISLIKNVKNKGDRYTYSAHTIISFYCRTLYVPAMSYKVKGLF
jgi:hypothetical protein